MALLAKFQQQLKTAAPQYSSRFSLNQMAVLFGGGKSNVARHLVNIFRSKELAQTSVVSKNATTDDPTDPDLLDSG